MGNYLTKIKSILGSFVPQATERIAAKKRKRDVSDTERDFEAALRDEIQESEAFESQEPAVTTSRVTESDGNNGTEANLVTNGVSLSQLNSIMNRMNQSEAVIRGRDRGMTERRTTARTTDLNESLRNSDLEGLLFARNRLASVT